MIALILRFIKSIGMMKLKTWPGGQDNPDTNRRTLPSPAPCSGTEHRGKVLDAGSTEIHGGAATVKERRYFTPQKHQ